MPTLNYKINLCQNKDFIGVKSFRDARRSVRFTIKTFFADNEGEGVKSFKSEINDVSSEIAIFLCSHGGPNNFEDVSLWLKFLSRVGVNTSAQRVKCEELLGFLREKVNAQFYKAMKEVHDTRIVRELLNPCHLDDVKLEGSKNATKVVADQVQMKQISFEGSVSIAMLQSITNFKTYLKGLNQPLVTIITELDDSFVNSIISSIKCLIEEDFINRWSKAYSYSIHKFDKKDDDEMKKSLEVFCGKMVHDICFLTPFLSLLQQRI